MDRRSDGGVAAVCAATEGEDHGGIFAVTPPSPTNPKPAYLSVVLLPSARHPRRTARHCCCLELVHPLALTVGRPLR
jgi:hypothetical protein